MGFLWQALFYFLEVVVSTVIGGGPIPWVTVIEDFIKIIEKMTLGETTKATNAIVIGAAVTTFAKVYDDKPAKEQSKLDDKQWFQACFDHAKNNYGLELADKLHSKGGL